MPATTIIGVGDGKISNSGYLKDSAEHSSKCVGPGNHVVGVVNTLAKLATADSGACVHDVAQPLARCLVPSDADEKGSKDMGTTMLRPGYASQGRLCLKLSPLTGGSELESQLIDAVELAHSEFNLMSFMPVMCAIGGELECKCGRRHCCLKNKGGKG